MRFLLIALYCGLCLAAPSPRVFPPPQQMEAVSGAFLFDDSVSILVPEKPSSNDTLLARILTAELSDWHAVARRQAARAAAQGRMVVMDDVANPLVAQYAARQGLRVTALDPGPEGYALKITPDLILIVGSDARGAFYGLQTLRQLIARSDGQIMALALSVRDRPYKPLRFFRLYLPSREDTPYLKNWRAMSSRCTSTTR